MTDTASKAATHTVGTTLIVPSKADLEVTFPNGFASTFKAYQGEVHVVLHTAGEFVIDGRKVEAV